jgi:hypothetical protein
MSNMMTESYTDTKSAMNQRTKTRSALSIDEFNVEKTSSSKHSSRLSCDNQTLALPDGRRSMDVQSINLAMWQGKYL